MTHTSDPVSGPSPPASPGQGPPAEAWRADIDGLRAVAVLPVLLFHAHVAGFSGGFVGVDVFFVVSGFLITSILDRDLVAGRYSLAQFYLRRVRRIFPALIAVALGTLLGAFFLVPPAHFVDVGEALQGTATFTANHLFQRVQSDYWDQNALAHQPLLHTWSLAVEEQFYVVLPLLMAALHRWGRGRRTALVVGLLSAASLAVAETLVRREASLAFYLLPARAWELLAGSLLALWARRGGVLSPPQRTWASILGLLGIGVAVHHFSEHTAFPGLSALLPVAGTALVLAAGTGPDANGLGTRLLRWRPLVFIGQISYSLYLVHWPLLVLFRSVGWSAWGLPELPVVVQLGVAGLVAVASWKWVEGPWRHGKRGERPGPVLRGAVVALGLLFLLGSITLRIGRRGWPVAQPLPAVVAELGTDTKVAPGLRCEGSDDPATILRDGGGCVVGQGGDTPPTVALFGDSHARMWTAAARALAEERAISVLILARSSCTPLPGVMPPTRAECRDLTEATFQWLERSSVRRVVLAGYWVDIAPAVPGADLAGTLLQAADRLRAAGKEVSILLDVPRLPQDGDALAGGIESVRLLGAEVRRRDEDLWQADAEPLRPLVEALRTRPDVQVLDPRALLCDERGCLVAKDRRTLYRDRQHLTDEGARILRQVLAPALPALGHTP